MTRYALVSFTITFLISPFLPLQVALVNIPYFTIFNLEVYRLLLCNFLCNGILNLIFGFIIFLDLGKRLEFAMGSTNFAVLLLIIGIGANSIFTAGAIILYIITGFKPYIMTQSGGIWILIFGSVALECSLAPNGSKKRLFVMDVPTIYYPLALLGLFTLFGFDSSMFTVDLLSIGIGYAYGYGKLDSLKVSVERRRRLEAGLLRSFTNRIGWVVGPPGNDVIILAPISSHHNSSINSNHNRPDEEQVSKISICLLIDVTSDEAFSNR